MDQQLLQEREEDITKLSNGVQEVSELFTDVSLMVTIQGEKLDNIENNIENTFSHIDRAREELMIIKKYRNIRRRCYCRFFIVITFTIGLIILISLLNNNK